MSCEKETNIGNRGVWIMREKILTRRKGGTERGDGLKGSCPTSVLKP